MAKGSARMLLTGAAAEEPALQFGGTGPMSTPWVVSSTGL